MSKQKVAIMVKIIILTLPLFFLCSCGKKTENFNENLVKTKGFNENVVFSDGIIRDGITAKKIADIILENTLKKDVDKYNFVMTNFEHQDSIWEITYCIDESTLGGDITITISKYSGEISIIYGE